MSEQPSIGSATLDSKIQRLGQSLKVGDGSDLDERRALVSSEGSSTGRVLRRGIRLPLLVIHAVAGLFLQSAMYLLRPIRDDDALERRVTQLWHANLCRLCGLRLRVVGEPVKGAALVASNHISWLDIPVLGSCLPAAFLSKDEVRKWPVIGWLATNAGTIYIARGRHGVRTISRTMHSALLSGRSVAFFPEGTTTSGENVRRFLPPLFSAAIEADVPVQPVAIRYPQGDAVHPNAPFVNNESMVTHVWRLLGDRGLDVEVTFCPALDPCADRRRLATETHAAIDRVVSGESAS